MKIVWIWSHIKGAFCPSLLLPLPLFCAFGACRAWHRSATVWMRKRLSETKYKLSLFFLVSRLLPKLSWATAPYPSKNSHKKPWLFGFPSFPHPPNSREALVLPGLTPGKVVSGHQRRRSRWSWSSWTWPRFTFWYLRCVFTVDVHALKSCSMHNKKRI